MIAIKYACALLITVSQATPFKEYHDSLAKPQKEQFYNESHNKQHRFMDTHTNQGTIQVNQMDTFKA